MGKTPGDIIERRLERRRTADAIRSLALRTAVLALFWIVMTGGLFRLVRAENDDPGDGIRKGDVLVTCSLGREIQEETVAVPGRIILVVHRLRPEPVRSRTGE